MKTFALTGPINLSARIAHGSVTVRTRADLTEATVEITPQSGAERFVDRVAIEMRGPTLVVQGPRQGGIMGGPGRQQSSLDVVVTVPDATAVKISTFTGEITINGRVGGADIATATGTVDLDTVDGDLRLRYGSAMGSVRLVTGSATVRSGSGDVRFGEVGGSLDAGCGSGRLDADVIRGSVRSRSGSGTARIGAIYGDVDLVSGSGKFAIGLPAGISARLDVKTGSGSVHSELPLDEAQHGAGHAITVRARTGSGDVRLFRAA